jgi:hypothetical protein
VINLKRFLAVLFFCLLSVHWVYADDFVFDVASDTVTAGVPFVVNIRAVIDGTSSTDLNYNRTAVLSVAPFPGTVSPTSPISFSGGNANAISITLYAAGSINITLTDPGLNTITSVAGWRRVVPGTPQRPLFLRHSEELQEVLKPGAPGPSGPNSGPGYVEVLHGYTGVTVSSGIPLAVTIVAIDNYFNIITGVPYQYNFLVNGLGVGPLTDTVTGVAAFSWTPHVSSNSPENQPFYYIGSYTIGSYGPNAISGVPFNAQNYVYVPSSCYLWTAAPTYVVAGVPFFVTATATTTNAPNSSIATWANYYFTMTPRLVNGTGLPGHGTLAPGVVVLNNGATAGNFTYTVAEAIQLVPSIDLASSPGAAGKTFNSGGYQTIQVLPAAPAALAIAVAPANIQAQKTAAISVTVRDAYQNLVPGAAVNFEKTAGSADSSVSPALTVTDGGGVARATFTGGIINEIATVRVSVGSLVQNVDIRISVAPPSGGDMINYPNPFNPNTQKTSINYYLKDASKVEIKIYDAFGRTVFGRTLNPGEGSGDFFNATAAGGASFLWDGRNGEGTMVGNGIYIVKLKATNSVEVQKFTRRVGVLK